MHTNFHKAYILHLRLYRESSYIAECFTEETGRLSLVCRGARRKKSRDQGLLQPFIPVLLSYVGRSDLKTLCRVEPAAAIHPLLGGAIRSGFYLNELLMSFLQHYDPYPALFQCYHLALQELSENIQQHEIILRKFEKELLTALGYALPLSIEAASGLAIESDKIYVFHSHQGFSLIDNIQTDSPTFFKGSSLLAIASDDFQNPDVLRDAKRLMRLALQTYLGNKRLKSRELFYFEGSYDTK